MLVRERIIVLDDLERRDAALSLETLFGYVDALKGKGCTVLLIYNEEELSTNQGKEWRAVREKCLDAEINLRPTPADACGLGLSPACPDREPIVATAEAAGLTNIRIIQRIERLTDAFRKAIPGREPQQPLPEYILRSLVFLAVLHYENRFPDKQVETFLEDWTGLRRSVGQHAARRRRPAGRAMQRHQRHRTAVPAVGLRAASPARRGPRDGQDAGAR